MSLPVVAIVGRPNVGKSSLLNALAGRRISIVQDMPGVTRDRVATQVQLDGKYIELIDTGGWGFEDPDKLTQHIQQQIELAMSSANLVLFLVDGQAGCVSGDEQIAEMLRRRGSKLILVANKCDGPNADAGLGDFARLGFGTPIGVSALQGRNLDLVWDTIASNLDLSDAPTELPPPVMMMAIVGKRNAGKSTLVNAIASLYEGDPNRVIVSEVPGTTRDSVDVRFEKNNQTLIVIDTAGVRRKRQIATHDLDFYGFHRAQRSIRRADVILMLLDATEPVSEPDKQLARYIADQFKPLVLVINKWDLAREKAREQRKEFKTHGVDDAVLMEEFREYLAEELPQIDFAPAAFITAKDGKNIQGVLDQAQLLFNQANARLTTGQLNRVVREILIEKLPSTPSGRKAKIFYATQTSVAPPTIVLFANNPAFLDDTYRRFMINRLRELLPYGQIPIKLVVRGRQQRQPAPSLDEKKPEEVESDEEVETNDQE